MHKLDEAVSLKDLKNLKKFIKIFYKIILSENWFNYF